MDKRLNELVSHIASLQNDHSPQMELMYEEVQHLEYLVERIGMDISLQQNIQYINRWAKAVNKLMDNEKKNLTSDFLLFQLNTFIERANYRMLEILLQVGAKDIHKHIS